jgi:hypothetical protein
VKIAASLLTSLLVVSSTLSAQTLFTPSGTLGTSSNGNVGVSNSAPDFKLDVTHDNYNAIRATGNSANSIGIFIRNTVASGRQWALISSGGGPSPVGNFTIWDDTAGVARFNIAPSGDVGIGTSSPQWAKLDIVQPTASYWGLKVRNTATGTASEVLWGYADSTNPNSSLIDIGSAAGGQFFVKGNGNVGLGTTEPQSKVNLVVGTSFTVPAHGELGSATSARFLMHGAEPGVMLSSDYGTGGQSGTETRLLGMQIGVYTASDVRPQIYYGGQSLEFVQATPNGSSLNRRLVINTDGNVGIGTTNPTQKLSVNGTIRAKEVIVDTNWADYVFEPNYRLAPLNEVESAIKQDGHLPGVPSAQEVAARGVSVGEMQATLLAKMEEMTLYVIELKKENAALRRDLEQLKAANKF